MGFRLLLVDIIFVCVVGVGSCDAVVDDHVPLTWFHEPLPLLSAAQPLLLPLATVLSALFWYKLFDGHLLLAVPCEFMYTSTIFVAVVKY